MTTTKGSSAMTHKTSSRITLPPGEPSGGVTVGEALRSRRSVRGFADDALDLVQVAQLLWAAQGVTHGQGFRTAPSAGALYPLETYLVSGNVRDLPSGVYGYDPYAHALDTIAQSERRPQLSDAAFSQDWIATSSAVIVLGAVPSRTTVKYGERGHRYIHMEVGHAAQNVYLQAVSLGLGTTMVGAFHDNNVQTVLDLPDGVTPLCLLPIGRPG